MNKQEISSEELAGFVIEGMQEKKGYEIVLMDLRGIHKSLADFFVICHATSATQAEALTDSVEAIVRQRAGQKPRSVEGTQHAEWILMDYFDVVVHIFLDSVRNFYKLESLWADAKLTKIEEQTGHGNER